jgi:hypothetical protein
MSPVSSVQKEDFDKTAPYTPDRQLSDAAGEMVVLTLSVEGLGDIHEYAVRIQVPAFDDNLKAIAGIVHSVHAAAFALNWGAES